MTNKKILDFLLVALKGFAMGAANVIPGVSGGTLALITGIYKKLILSLKSFDGLALKLLFKGKLAELITHINGVFLLALLLGVGASIFSIAKLFDYLLVEHPIEIWSFFFGLILASVYYVGLTVDKWTNATKLFFVLGTAIALTLATLNPAPTANENYIFVFICGIIGISGMLLPGLSGSYILMLMGNYKLLMVDSINALSTSLKMLLSGNLSFLQNHEMTKNLILFSLFLFGSIFGLLSFSRVIAWIFERYKNATISLLTGFVFGSLAIIWPWKNEIKHDSLVDRHGEAIIVAYERYMPVLNIDNLIPFGCIGMGILCIWGIERMAETKTK